MRIGLTLLLAVVIALAAAAPAGAVYGRNGPYLDYATMVQLGEHGKLPRSVYPFGTYYTPVTVAQYGLQAAANQSVTGRRVHRADALLAANWLVRHQRSDGGWRYRFRFRVTGFAPLEPGWISAMAQGQAMSLLWRAYRLRPHESYRRAAVRAVRPFGLSPPPSAALYRTSTAYRGTRSTPPSPARTC